MVYNMIQHSLTLIIEVAVCSLPVLWLHYLWSLGSPTDVREECIGAAIEVPVIAESLPLYVEKVEPSWLARVKRYKMHGYQVVKVADFLVQLPAGVKRYRLRSQAVVRVQDLLAAQ